MISGCGKGNISHSQFQKILFIATVVGPSPIGFDSAFGKANRLPQRLDNNGRFFLSQDTLRKTFKKIMHSHGYSTAGEPDNFGMRCAGFACSGKISARH